MFANKPLAVLLGLNNKGSRRMWQKFKLYFFIKYCVAETSVSALHQTDLQTNANNKNNFSPLVFKRNIAAFSKFDSRRKYVRYFNLLHLGSVPYLTSLPFPNFAFCLQNIEEAELKFLMKCVTNQSV
jgi:hypothetical protein